MAAKKKEKKSNRHRLVFPFKSQPSVGAVDLVDCLDQSKSPSLDHVTWSRFTRSFILMPPFITIIIIIIIIFRRQQKSTLSRPPEGKTKPDSGETKDEHGRQRQKEPAGAERPKEKKKKVVRFISGDKTTERTSPCLECQATNTKKTKERRKIPKNNLKKWTHFCWKRYTAKDRPLRSTSAPLTLLSSFVFLFRFSFVAIFVASFSSPFCRFFTFSFLLVAVRLVRSSSQVFISLFLVVFVFVFVFVFVKPAHT